jgi:hypothetical protein
MAEDTVARVIEISAQSQVGIHLITRETLH